MSNGGAERGGGPDDRRNRVAAPSDWGLGTTGTQNNEYAPLPLPEVRPAGAERATEQPESVQSAASAPESPLLAMQREAARQRREREQAVRIAVARREVAERSGGSAGHGGGQGGDHGEHGHHLEPGDLGYSKVHLDAHKDFENVLRAGGALDETTPRFDEHGRELAPLLEEADTVVLPRVTETASGREEAPEQPETPVIGAKERVISELAELYGQERGAVEFKLTPEEPEATIDTVRKVYGTLDLKVRPFKATQYRDLDTSITELCYQTANKGIVVVERWSGDTGDLVETKIVKTPRPVERDMKGRMALSDEAIDVIGDHIPDAPEGKGRKRHRIFKENRHDYKVDEPGRNEPARPTRREATKHFREDLVRLGMPSDIADTLDARPSTAREVSFALARGRRVGVHEVPVPDAWVAPSRSAPDAPWPGRLQRAKERVVGARDRVAGAARDKLFDLRATHDGGEPRGTMMERVVNRVAGVTERLDRAGDRLGQVAGGVAQRVERVAERRGTPPPVPGETAPDWMNEVDDTLAVYRVPELELQRVARLRTPADFADARAHVENVYQDDPEVRLATLLAFKQRAKEVPQMQLRLEQEAAPIEVVDTVKGLQLAINKARLEVQAARNGGTQ